jgi:hypothetical protein
MSNKKESLFKSHIFDGVATVETPDSAGETLILKGADLTPLNQGVGFLNADHGKSFGALLGRVISAKPIHKKSDCQTPEQVAHWNRLDGKPFLHVRGEIFSGDPRLPEANAVAAVMDHYKARGLPSPLKLSVEGSVTKRDGKRLVGTRIKGIAVTLVPCLEATSTDLVNVIKSHGADPDSLMKSDQAPSFREVSDQDQLQKAMWLTKIAMQIIEDSRLSKKK